MSTITRAFTKRNKRPEVSAPMPYRPEGHVRFNSASAKRGNISGPVQLLSTTNMLAYNAPDLHSSTSSSASSVRSRDELDAISPHSYASSMTSPDVSPHDSYPIDANPLASYFPKRSATVTSQPRSSTTSSSSTDAPLVPKRALSHTKRSHQDLAHKRSQSRMSPPPVSAPHSNPVIRSSQDMFQSQVHPFVKELEQVNEVAEEFGVTPLMDEERALYCKGLKKFSVDDYLTEIEDLYGSIFDDKLGPTSAGPWL
ncbi:uncharacterized protein N7459_004451 [Penicillium hispanicum]|uniref:uncharacterized protein n=1 Tax=Penicillium hispanicum TaxID=1080232 RepID=UPI002540ED9F|nr:uncharacterized protein N7459_004451 [Penicillium hispanicum]KAJ5584651.1 hypothetical protein N7459_004451 [Penicillium hispanicum]